MIRNFVGKGIVELTEKEVEEIPSMIAHELPNIDMYKTAFQFKFMDIHGNWQLVNIVHVKNEDEVEKGVNFLCSQIIIEG
ncbi:MAG: hypothetical protein ACTSWK_04160 [Promethearchaeota archaeon]